MSHNSSFPPGLPADPLICRGPQRIRDVRQQITGCWALWAWHRDRGRRGLLGHTGACLPGAPTASRPNELTWTWCMFLQLCWVFCSQRHFRVVAPASEDVWWMSANPFALLLSQTLSSPSWSSKHQRTAAHNFRQTIIWDHNSCIHISNCKRLRSSRTVCSSWLDLFSIHC